MRTFRNGFHHGIRVYRIRFHRHNTYHHLYLTVHQEKSRANSRRYIKSTNNVGFVNFTSVIGDFDKENSGVENGREPDGDEGGDMDEGESVGGDSGGGDSGGGDCGGDD